MEDTEKLPWAPIYTVERSGHCEMTLYGIVYVWAEEKSLFSNAGRRLIGIGDRLYPLWTRSLLKPWQLLNLLPTLKSAYPVLTNRHYALMIASQQCDEAQLAVLNEILQIGELKVESLQCPACQPMSVENAFLQKQQGIERSVLFNPCCGKHLAHLLYLKVKGESSNQYLNPQADHFQRLKAMLAYLTGKEPEEILYTIDGCKMPNYSLNAVEIAQLYHALTQPLPKDVLKCAPDVIEPLLEYWNEIRDIIGQHPSLFGGQGRLDSSLVAGTWQNDSKITIVAKEGADGLLAVGVGSCKPYPDGLGMLIKLSSGYDSEQLETVVMGVLEALEIKEKTVPLENEVVCTRFHFELSQAEIRA